MGWEGNAYVVHEFSADRANFLAEGGTEHHHLFVVRRGLEDFLDIAAHV